MNVPGGGNPLMLFVVEGRQNMYVVLKKWLADAGEARMYMQEYVKKMR